MPMFKVHFVHIDQHGQEEKKAREVVADNTEQARSVFAKEFRRLHPTPHRQIILKCKLVREARFA